MFKYEFIIPHTKEEIKHIVDKLTLPYEFSKIFTNGIFMSRFVNDGFLLVRTHNGGFILDDVKYFRCKLYDHEEGCKLVGRFVPSKSFLFFFCMFAAIVVLLNLCLRNFFHAMLLFIMLAIYCFMVNAIVNLPTNSKKNILNLIRYKLNGTSPEDYNKQKKNGTYRKIKKLRCHCCGNYTIDDDEMPIVEICPVCFWQYDEVGNENPDKSIGSNKVSLNEARENYKKYGAISDEYVNHVRQPLEEELPQNNT